MTTSLVTGATDGIGLATSHALAALGHTVLVHGRSEEKATLAAKKVGATAVPVWGDLASFAQVRALAEQVRAKAPVLDVLINNAGIFATTRSLSTDGFELTMAVNHLAPFLLTHLLLPSLRAAPRARIVNVSSMAHARGAVDLSDFNFEKRFEGYDVYAASKVANVLFTHELARRLGNGKLTTFSLHPGVITTKLLKAGFSMTGASVEEGARTSVFAATSPTLEGKTGLYLSDGREAKASPRAFNPALEKALYEQSAAWTKVEPL